MAAPQRREYITLQYHPQTAFTPEALRDLTRTIEGILQRMEGRIEALQEEVRALTTRVAALE
jgi:hypothetical protein